MDHAALSVVVIAKNEEKRLPECLQSVAFANEIILLDDNSTDRTVEIAKQFGAKVFQRTMDNEGRHRNYAINLATQDWILTLDADERVTPELAEDMRRVCQKKDDPHVAYDMAMKQFIGSEWIQGAGYYPAHRTKMFRRGRFSYKEEEVHPPCQYNGTVGLLRGDLLHFTSPSLEDWIRKFNRETSLEAKKWVRDGRKIGPWRAIRKAFSRFLKYYFQRDGIRHGYTGFLMCFFHFAYQIITYAKYRELKNQSTAK
ncbi:MAG TPA: glycosyltransferase family 2 protein [Candidatus Omnitrophota bacterium]|nr:glycosyltransferase family 2 protein [Candidatus Omnitrophota bacterium]